MTDASVFTVRISDSTIRISNSTIKIDHQMIECDDDLSLFASRLCYRGQTSGFYKGRRRLFAGTVSRTVLAAPRLETRKCPLLKTKQQQQHQQPQQLVGRCQQSSSVLSVIGACVRQVRPAGAWSAPRRQDRDRLPRGGRGAYQLHCLSTALPFIELSPHA